MRKLSFLILSLLLSVTAYAATDTLDGAATTALDMERASNVGGGQFFQRGER